MIATLKAGMPAAFLIALVSLQVGQSAEAKNIAGRVQKQTLRVERPLAEDQLQTVELRSQTTSNAPVSSRISDDTFVLNAKKFNAAAALDGWEPLKGMAPVTASPSKLVPVEIQNSRVTPLAVDYDAIETAYAEAIPRAPQPRAAGLQQPGHQQLPPHIAAALANGTLNANGSMVQAPVGTSVATGNVPVYVDGDMCACHMLIPSDNCVRSRMDGFGVRTTVNAPVSTGSFTTPQVRVPGTMVPTVRPSPVRMPTGIPFTMRLR